MRYVWAKGTPAAKKRVHIQAFDRSGEPVISDAGNLVAICRQPLPFNRSINAPFALGRKVCKHCKNIIGRG